MKRLIVLVFKTVVSVVIAIGCVFIFSGYSLNLVLIIIVLFTLYFKIK